ncbi:MAG: hypothetical protein LBE33_06260 [Zoogloeaceae bacterium]|jgi:hypothetical protein|nr:hypothetical protein [Zoogloeaceae bacterium]
MSSWSCPHDLNGICQKVAGAVCDPGMRGCVLHGKVRFINKEESPPRKPVKAPQPAAAPPSSAVKAPKRRLPF